MKKLMAIFSHPDDEGAMSGTLIKYAQMGYDVTLICATRGEVGEISDPALATPETLGEVRQQELEAAAEIIGLRQIFWLDRRDSGMVDTPPNEDPRAFIQSDPDEMIGKLVEIMRAETPDVVVTFEPFGWYGHPDHRIMSTWATQAYALLNDANAFPDRGTPYQPSRLYHSVIPFSRFRGLFIEAFEAGYIDKMPDFGSEPPSEERLAAESQVTHVVSTEAFQAIRKQATSCHRTQFGPDHIFNKIPDEMMASRAGSEHFIQVDPAPDPAWVAKPLDDLFANL